MFYVFFFFHALRTRGVLFCFFVLPLLSLFSPGVVENRKEYGGAGSGGGVVVITELQGDGKIKATILYYSLYAMWEM